MEKAQEAVDAVKKRIARIPEIANRENLEKLLSQAQYFIVCGGRYVAEQKKHFREAVFEDVAKVEAAADRHEEEARAALEALAGNPPKKEITPEDRL